MRGRRPPLDEEKSLWEATVAAEGVTTSAGEGTGLSLVDAGLAGSGANSYVSMMAVIYPGQPTLVDSKDITAFTDGDGTVTVASAFKGGQVAAGVPYKIVTFRFVPAEVATLQATLGALNTAAATGAVSDVKKAMAYIKQLVVNTYRLAEAADGTGVFPASVADDSLFAKLMSTGDPAAIAAFDNTKHSLKAIRDAIYIEHTHARILFITPEAVGSISDDNTAIKTELDKLGTVDHIVQTDALDFPNFTIYDLCVLGSNSNTAWITDNLADIKTVPGLPILCFDKIAAAYLEMGTDGGDAAAKTTIDVSAKIEASVLGMGSYYKGVTGLVKGVSTISTSATYHTLDMGDEDLTEIVYATADADVDILDDAEHDVVLGFLPGVLEDASIGLDEEGEELPATLAFFGAGYEANKLTTLGRAVIYLTCHILIRAQKKAAEVAGTIANLRRLLVGDMGGQFGNTNPVVEWLVGQNTAGTKLPAGVSLYDILYMMRGLVYVAAVTTATSETEFAASSLAGLGTGMFKPNAGAPWEIYVLEADGAAPEGLQTPVVTYTTGTGVFTHADLVTDDLAVGDIVVLIHPLLASLGTKATAAAEGAVTTDDYLMAYIKQLVTEVQVVDGLVDTLATDTDPLVKGKRQTFEKAVTSAANAADTTLATIASGSVVIESIVVFAVAAQTGDMTNAAVKGGAGKAITFIAAADLLQADVNAEDKQVAWEGKVRLNTGDTILMEHEGTGATALNLVVAITFYASSANGATMS